MRVCPGEASPLPWYTKDGHYALPHVRFCVRSLSCGLAPRVSRHFPTTSVRLARERCKLQALFYVLVAHMGRDATFENHSPVKKDVSVYIRHVRGCVKSGDRMVACPSSACSCVCLDGCTFRCLVFLFRFLRNKVPSQEPSFSTSPLPPKSKVEMEPPQSCNTRAMKSTIHARRHGLRNRWSTLDLGGQGEANKLICQSWYFIS